MFTNIKLLHKVNSLQNKVDTLETSIKNELYKTFMEKLGEPLEINRLRNENKELRKKIRTLRELLKEGK